MEYPRNVTAILQSIKDYKGFKTNADLAEFLGITRSAISNWIARDYIDEVLILSKIPEIRLTFLRSGEYPMTEQSDTDLILQRKIEALERRIVEQEREQRELRAQIEELRRHRFNETDAS